MARPVGDPEEGIWYIYEPTNVLTKFLWVETSKDLAPVFVFEQVLPESSYPIRTSARYWHTMFREIDELEVLVWAGSSWHRKADTEDSVPGPSAEEGAP